MKLFPRLLRCLACSCLVGLPVAAQAQGYSIGKFTIAGGGGTSTGGVHSVSGTIGQAVAGAPLSGGIYALGGGYWALPSAVQTPGTPLLSIEKLAGSNVRVFWPLPADGFVLDQATSLVSPPATNAWSQVPFPYTTNATHISLTMPATANKFYRLRKP